MKSKWAVFLPSTVHLRLMPTHNDTLLNETNLLNKTLMSVISKGSAAWLSASPCTTFLSIALQGCQMCHLAPHCPGNWLQASKDLAESMKMLAASKRKCPNRRVGTRRRRIKRLCAPQFVHCSEIIVLLSVPIQAAKQIYDTITRASSRSPNTPSGFQKVPLVGCKYQ